MTATLPARPHLEHLKKQAKELLRDQRAGDRPLRGDRSQRFMEEGAVIDGVPVRVVEMTSGTGDAVLWHPALYHSRSFNCISVPRFMRT